MTSRTPRISAIVVAAGKGERTGGDIPKQFRLLRGKPLLRWSVEKFATDTRFEKIIVVHGAEQTSQTRTALEGIADITLVAGGESRQQSVRRGLDALAMLPLPPDQVFIHDAARPFIPDHVLSTLIAALDTYQGSVPALEVVDTIVLHEGSVLGDTVARETLRRIQTPQAFHFDAIVAAHKNRGNGDATDDAQLLRGSGMDVSIVPGSHDLEKITFAEDFTRAEMPMTQAPRTAVGMGYDVHRLVSGKPLWLGGIEIPHDKGLAGHSDADVALHALTDAILGALAEGDIGQHFPPTDPQWRGAASSQFLSFAGERAKARGGILQSVDVTIVCEAPKIGPYREQIRKHIAKILQLPVEHISVKATTTERLGFAGRGEGIAVQAIVSISFP